MKFILLLFMVGFINVSHAQTNLRAWSKVTDPTTGKTTESIGKYTAGCIRGAATLAHNGKGYQVMRLSRKRYFGHPDLVRFIENLGQTAQSQRLGTLLIGDLGQARGGPTLTGHKSHQTGLDVDIWYLLSTDAERRTLSNNEREKWSAPSVLNASATEINPRQWSIANEKVLEAAANRPEVDRIFVNAVIKKELCRHNARQNWLQKIRPWYAHADHFHVRLKCHPGDLYCDKQDPVPSGDGCGADLAWWFSYEAKHPKPGPPPPPVVLPKECDVVIGEN
ncbi:penicillin-insensitive murein DD-endopeptidase [biofilm metagenome]